MIDFSPGATSANPHGSRFRINVRITNGRQIDYETSVTYAKARRVVSSTSDRKLNSLFARKVDRCDYVRDISASSDPAWTPLDHRVVYLPGLFIRRVGRFDQFALQFRLELCYHSFLRH